MPYHYIKSVDGKRGGVLVLLGFLYLLKGLASLITPESDAVDQAFRWLPDWIDSNELAGLWFIGGAAMLVSGLRSKRHSGEKVGFFFAIFVPFIWCFIYATSTVFGNELGPRGAVGFFMIFALFWYISGWGNPVEVERLNTDAS